MCTNHGAVVWWLSVGAHNAGIEGSNPEWLIMKAVGREATEATSENSAMLSSG